MAETKNAPPAKKKDPEEIRQKVLADPNTEKIAAKLGVSLERYVAGVVRFAMNPTMLPEFQTMAPQEIERRYGAPMNRDQILTLFRSEMEQALIAEKTDYRDAKRQLVALPTPPMVETRTEDPKLKEELAKQLLGTKPDKG
jgi:hypothetical protein